MKRVTGIGGIFFKAKNAPAIDPGWQNPFTGGTPQETTRRLASVEVIHWALLAASVGPVAAALWYGHHVLGFVCVAVNMLFNVAPNLVMRDTRKRLLRLSGRTPAAGANTDRSVGDGAPRRRQCPVRFSLQEGLFDRGCCGKLAPI
jgi:hypothetical protein